MVKRLKAILLLTLMLGSARFAKAETPKGEVYKTNKTNIETKSPVEDTSLENNIVKTDEKTGEEVIVGQEQNELDVILAQFQSEECRQIASLIYEIAEDKKLGNEPQITDKEIIKRKNELMQILALSTGVGKSEDAGLLFASKMINSNVLSEEEMQNLSNEYCDTDVFDSMCDIFFMYTGGNGYHAVDQDVSYVDLSGIIANPKCRDLVKIMSQENQKVGKELKKGGNVSHYQELSKCYMLAEQLLKGTGTLMAIRLIPGCEFTGIMLIYLSEKYPEHYDMWDGVLDNSKPIDSVEFYEMVDISNKMKQISLESGIKDICKHILGMSEEVLLKPHNGK